MIAALALALATVWFRGEPMILYGIDAPCYADIARDLAARPISEWGERFWRFGTPFYEHPPLALWVEALAMKLFGATPQVAVVVARAWATLLVFAVAKGAREPRVAAFSVLGLVLLGAFHFESQNPMLDLPFTAACALALASSGPLFGLALGAALLIKGPPALALLLFVRDRRTAAASLAAIAGAVAVVGVPFLREYGANQVAKSLLEGRHAPNGPFYYVTPLLMWYAPALLAIVLARKNALYWRSLLWIAAIVGGFSLARNKYDWYIHPIMPAAAWLIGLTADRFLPQWRLLPRVIAAATVAWVVAAFVVPFPLTQVRAEVFNAQNATPPPPGALVGNCAPQLGEWRAEHLFAFLWRAHAVNCDDARATWRYDGLDLHARACENSACSQ